MVRSGIIFMLMWRVSVLDEGIDLGDSASASSDSLETPSAEAAANTKNIEDSQKKVQPVEITNTDNCAELIWSYLNMCLFCAIPQHRKSPRGRQEKVWL